MLRLLAKVMRACTFLRAGRNSLMIFCIFIKNSLGTKNIERSLIAIELLEILDFQLTQDFFSVSIVFLA
jgi:hypothetical protein